MENPEPASSAPLAVTPVDGKIAIAGPGGLRASLSVEAAVASAERLLAAVRAIAPDAVADNDDGQTYQKPLG